jgi:hypothetical protein
VQGISALYNRAQINEIPKTLAADNTIWHKYTLSMVSLII